MDKQTYWIIGGGIVVVALALGLYVLGRPTEPKPKAQTEQQTTTTMDNNQPVAKATNSAVIKTTMGDITVELYGENTPKTVENFMKLAQSGFYDGVKFHRIIKGFMNQAGDPNSKDDSKVAQWGTGGPGYRFADEIDLSSALVERGYKKGVLAMANAGPNTNGSQFFIMAADYTLPPNYTIFGYVTDGLDVVTAINNTPTDQNDRPVVPVVIKSITAK